MIRKTKLLPVPWFAWFVAGGVTGFWLAALLYVAVGP